MKHIRSILFVIIIVVLALYLNLFSYQKSFAAMAFGGRITPPIITCTNGLLLTIGPPRGGMFLLPPTARIYAFFNIKPGAWTLGAYNPGGVCVLPPPAGSITVKGTIIMIGTSK